MTQNPKSTDGVYTVVRLAYHATVERACELAGIKVDEVDFIQRHGEIAPKELPENYRIVSFDATQITISERIGGERRVRGFAAT